MKITLFPNLTKSGAAQTATDAIKLLKISGAEFLDFRERSQAEFVLAVGGDGTIIQCAHEILGMDVKLIGINSGRLGFMASVEHDQLALLRNLKTGDYRTSKRMMLKVAITDEEGVTTFFHALNDIFFKRDKFKMGEFSIDTDDSHIGSYRADGVMFSTPTGSTAYALSLGGPVIEPYCECIEMTLIAPHNFFRGSMIFSPERVLKIKLCSDEFLIVIDGRDPLPLNKDYEITLSVSEYTTNIVEFSKADFHQTLRKKITS